MLNKLKLRRQRRSGGKGKDKAEGEVEGGVSSEDWDVAFEDLVFEETVGGGAFGTVFKGDYLGVPVAIKRLNPVTGLSPEQVDKYIRREVSLLKGIHHPNVVQFMGLCKNGNDQYIITEYVSGGNLKDFLEQHDSLTWKTKVILALDIAVAFNFMHKKCLIYRDIKPENLLVTENERVKVCDLGLARTKSKARYMTIAGSDDYMAPEVLLGEQYGEKCDVFGYGALVGVIAARRKMPMRSPSTGYAFNLKQVASMMPADCPPRLTQLILACCVTDHEARPSFTEVVATLKDILKEVGGGGGAITQSMPDYTIEEETLDPEPAIEVSVHPAPTASSPTSGSPLNGSDPAAAGRGTPERKKPEPPKGGTSNDFFTQRFLQKETKLTKKVGTGVSGIVIDPSSS